METGMTKTARMLMSVVALVLSGSLGLWSAAEADNATRTVQGKVIAVNLQSTPNVIVVKVILPTKQEMIVGATVGSGVAITRDMQAIGLDGITPGQTVSLTYVKHDNGLDARSIQVRN